MVIKSKFELLKDVPNFLSLPAATIKDIKVVNGARKILLVLKMMENKIGNHFTKKKIYETLDILETRKMYEVVIFPDYNLPITYNKPTRQLLINLSAFTPPTDDIYPNNPDPKNVYAAMVYAICFYNLTSEKINISERYFSTISSFLTSLFVQVFGRQFGLLGTYSSEIPILKFLISTYILTSFFGIDQQMAYKKASVASGVDFKNLKEDLEKGNYDFKNIIDFINSLSDLKVMAGINKYSFTDKIYRMIGPTFLPGLEDFSRFISIITTSSISGSNLVNTTLYRYNKDEYLNLLKISEVVFKK